MPNHDFFVLAITQAFVAFSTLSINLFFAYRRQFATSRTDSAKLRLAVAAELASLRDLYKDNVDALYAGKDVLVSCRLLQGVYRGNLARIHSLAETEIPTIVASYAACEKAEALLAAHGRAHGQSAFSLGKDRPFADDLIAAYERAGAAAERALRAMSETNAYRRPLVAASALREESPVKEAVIRQAAA